MLFQQQNEISLLVHGHAVSDGPLIGTIKSATCLKIKDAYFFYNTLLTVKLLKNKLENRTQCFNTTNA